MTVLSKSLFQASTVDGGYAQRDSSIAVYADGTFSISWSDETNITGLGVPDILGQHFTAAGSAVGAHSHLSGIYFDGPQQHGDILDLGGNILVVYQTQDQAMLNTSENVTYELIQKDGTPLYARKTGDYADPANVHGVFQKGDETAPTVALLGSGGFMISYVDDATGSDKNIRGVFVAADGTEGAMIDIDSAAYDATAPDSASLSDGNIAVVYESGTNAGDIRFAVCSGSAVIASGSVATALSAENNPHVAGLQGGGFVVVWEDSSGDDAGNAGIRAAVYTSAGASAGSFSVNTAGTAGIQRQPAVTALHDGGFMVAWVNDPDGTIAARRFDASGTAVEDQFVMADLDALTEPRLATLSDGRVVLSVTNTDAANDQDIYAAIWDPRSPATSGADTISGDGSANTIDGLAGNDVLHGLGNADTLIGNDGNDTLDGGTGSDVLLGGAGNDSYIVDAAGDRVYETTTKASTADAGGIDTVLSAVSLSLDAYAGIRFVENLTLTGLANSNATGNGLANRLAGNAGNNTLNGGLGNDILLGGAGNDAYVVDTAGDRVYETTTAASAVDAGGTDTVLSSVGLSLDAYAGIRFVERLTLTGTGNINAIGNALDNRLTGNAGNNTLNGGLGNDILLGGAGNDTYIVDAAGDRVYETTTTASTTDAGGTDAILSAVSLNLDAYAGIRFVENLTLTGSGNVDAAGNALGNRLTGNAGNNILSGGAGNDSLTGGVGQDSFRFNSALGAANIDVIQDFNVVDDTILLARSTFGAFLTAGALGAGAFNTGTAASEADDRIIFNTASGALIYDADGSGAGIAIHFATLRSVTGTLGAGDFTIV